MRLAFFLLPPFFPAARRCSTGRHLTTALAARNFAKIRPPPRHPTFCSIHPGPGSRPSDPRPRPIHTHTPPPLHLAARATTDPAARPERLPGDPTPSFLPSIRRGKARSPSPAHRDVHGSPHRAQRPCRPIPSSPGRPCPPRPPSKIPHPLSPHPPPLLCLPLFSFCFGPPPLSLGSPFFFGSPPCPCLRACGGSTEGGGRGGEARPRNPPSFLPLPSLLWKAAPDRGRVLCFVSFFVFPAGGGRREKEKAVRSAPPPPLPPVRGREEEQGEGRRRKEGLLRGRTDRRPAEGGGVGRLSRFPPRGSRASSQSWALGEMGSVRGGSVGVGG